MINSSLFRATALLAALGATLPLATARFAAHNTSTPVIFGLPPLVTGNESLTIEVDLSQITLMDQVVNISTLNSSNWSNLPSQVVVPAGQSKVFFNATTSPSAFGIIDGSASCNGGTAVGIAVGL